MIDKGLTTNKLSFGYNENLILSDFNLHIPQGKISVIVGANACGKSTLLKCISRLITPKSGSIYLDGKSIHQFPSKQLARKLGLLPQSPIAPEGITVLDLVSRGRHPHVGVFSRWSKADNLAVAQALTLTRTDELSDRLIDELSGGQRQRVWIAMALAQETDTLLLDEPTTYLDISHQIDVLDLLTDLNHLTGKTIIMVLHDLNLAARYADFLIAMVGGRLHAAGAPEDVLTVDNVRQVFNIPSQIIEDPISGRPIMMPIGRHHQNAIK